MIKLSLKALIQTAYSCDCHATTDAERDLFLTGAGQRSRCIPVSTITNYLGVDVSRCLPGFHAFTGNAIK